MLVLAAVGCLAFVSSAFGRTDESQAKNRPAPRLGTAATAADMSAWDTSVTPDGKGLPSGSGTPSAGARVFAARCAYCHGMDLQGVTVDGRARYPALAGGLGTLATDHPKKSVGSFWPYATTVFDYIRRAMPFDRPQTLTSDEVFAVTAYILARNQIIGDDATMNAQTLPKVTMPNRNGFYVNRTEGGLETLDSP
jgi:mono/diheme cytochrome c family protein